MDTLERKFYRTHRLPKHRDFCPHCGEPLCPKRQIEGYGCSTCNSTRPLDFRLHEVVWREAQHARTAGRVTARRFFNSLHWEAKTALMRELISRQQVGQMSRTRRWLERGLLPGSL